MDLFDIAAKIRLDSSEYESGLSDAEKKGSGFANKLKSGLKTAAKVGTAAVAAIGTGAVALGKSFVSGISDLAAYGDQIDKNSQKMGISAQAYQEWDFILQHSGSSIDAMSKGMQTLSKKAEDNADAFEKLGIAQEDLASMSKEDIFAKTIEGLQQMEAGTERDALAMELFGGAAKELGPLLNTTADEVNDMRKQVNELGGVMGDDAVKNAAAFQDALQNLKTAFSGIKRAFLSNFLPSFTKVLDGLTAIFGGDSKGGVAKIKDGINEIINSLSEKIPEFLEIGFSIIDGIVTAINDNLPMLLEKGADILLNGIIPGILEKLPDLVATAFSIIGQLASSIGEALPELIPAVIQIILQIVDTLLSPEGIDHLIDGAIGLIMGLADGIISAIPILIEKAPEIVIKLVEAIIRNAPKLLTAAVELIKKLVSGIGSALNSVFVAGKELVEKIGEGIASLWSKVKSWGADVIKKVWEGLTGGISDAFNWGKDMIENFGKGITAKAQALLDKVKGIAAKIASYLGFSEPEEGPLSDFHTYAPDMMELFMKGIEDNKRKLTDTVADAFDFGGLFTAPTMRTGAVPALAGASASGFDGTVNLYIDGDTLVGSTSDKMDRDLGDIQKIKARWGGKN